MLWLLVLLGWESITLTADFGNTHQPEFAFGLYLFLSGARLSRARKLGLCGLSVVVIGFTVVGMTVAPPPPSAAAMAATSLVAIVAVSALAGWLGRAPGPGT